MDDLELSKLLSGVEFGPDDIRKQLQESLLVDAQKYDKNRNRYVFDQLKNTNPELAAIAMNETSGGLNLNHPVDKKSGTQAGGLFALMPRTVTDTMQRNPDLQQTYPNLNNMAGDWKTNHADITKYIENNPQVAQALAQKNLDRAKKVFDGDLDKTAMS